MDALGAVCFASALASVCILHCLAKAGLGTDRADTRYAIRYLSLLGCVLGLSPVSMPARARRRDLRAVRPLHLVFATAASLMAWFAMPLLRAALR
ncbi:hypothetical protein SAMN04487997_2661 [Frateuria terrea]|uniref:Uncharacterized protein n=1 Tax=Frateuria terrea TaxID=529704 RepID=A0A1H6WMX4_9GAMM|nr:hypothetical protein SAMN04487997_2661 [Frateuria terrea]SFP56936.1 hypothetical protein SAMN02927913_2638 [Frateuria terrea]